MSIHRQYPCKVLGCAYTFFDLKVIKSHYEFYHKSLPFPESYALELKEERYEQPK